MARFKRNMCEETAQATAYNDIFLKGCVLYLLVKEESRKGMDKDDLICAQTKTGMPPTLSMCGKARIF